jgi:hypothetical protein
LKINKIALLPNITTLTEKYMNNIRWGAILHDNNENSNRLTAPLIRNLKKEEG